MLHDAGGTLGTKNTLVDGVITVTLYIADLWVAIITLSQMYIDATSAGTHVTGGMTDFVRNQWAGVKCSHSIRVVMIGRILVFLVIQVIVEVFTDPDQ